MGKTSSSPDLAVVGFNEAPINRPGKFVEAIRHAYVLQRFNEAPINRPGKCDA